MVVQAGWPGATLDDTLQQVTDRIERALQETPSLDFLRSYTSPGKTTIFVNLKGETTAAQIPDIWYHVRKSIGDMRPTLPAGVVGPGFNDEFGDVFGIIHGVTADGFTHRELKDHVEEIRSRLMQVPDVAKIEILGAQDEKIFVEFSVQQLAGLGSTGRLWPPLWRHRTLSAHPGCCRPAMRGSPCAYRARSNPSRISWT